MSGRAVVRVTVLFRTARLTSRTRIFYKPTGREQITCRFLIPMTNQQIAQRLAVSSCREDALKLMLHSDQITTEQYRYFKHGEGNGQTYAAGSTGDGLTGPKS